MMIEKFIDDLYAQGFAVESICRVLTEQGCQIAARTYRAWKARQVSNRDITDAYVMNRIWDLFHSRDHQCGGWKKGSSQLSVVEGGQSAGDEEHA